MSVERPDVENIPSPTFGAATQQAKAAKIRDLIGDDVYTMVKGLGLLGQVESELLPCTMEPPDPSIFMAQDFGDRDHDHIGLGVLST